MSPNDSDKPFWDRFPARLILSSNAPFPRWNLATGSLGSLSFLVDCIKYLPAASIRVCSSSSEASDQSISAKLARLLGSVFSSHFEK